MSFHAIVPAAGVGRRMGASLPKQYLRIHGKMVIDWSIQSLLQQPDITSVVVALSKDDDYWKTTFSASDPRIHCVEGGEERCYSVLNALTHLLERCPESDWVLVHDAARPCVAGKDISRLMRQCHSPDGALLGMPVQDTMKRTDHQGWVLETVDRNLLWHAQTPQAFPLGILYKALDEALKAGIGITDESSAMEWAGYRPCVVEASSNNIKITRQSDLELAAFFLQSTPS